MSAEFEAPVSRRKAAPSPGPDSHCSQAPAGRVIAHVDMDAYFVEVELLSRPELRGRKLIVAHDSHRSVVLSASYQARQDGVGSAMPLSRARQLSPDSLILPPHQHRYREISQQIMAYFGAITDTVEQLSVDEAFLDITGARRRLGPPEAIGELIRRQIREQFGLPCTVGIADRKFIAKIASTRAKPDGMLVVPPAQRAAFLHSLPVSALWGVGRKTEQSLHAMGIRSVRQLAESPPEVLHRRLGAIGDHLYRLSWGDDERGVQTEREEKSIGAEETFSRDIETAAELRSELLRLSHRVAARLRESGLSAGGIAIKLRYRDFETLSRSSTLRHATQSALAIHAQATAMLDRLGPMEQPVRLLGVRAERLNDSGGSLQLSFDRQEGNWADAETALDEVSRRFPQAQVAPASLLRKEPPSGYEES